MNPTGPPIDCCISSRDTWAFIWSARRPYEQPLRLSELRGRHRSTFTLGFFDGSGDLEQLSERLAAYGITAEEYVAAIELSAGRSSGHAPLADRLSALHDVLFDGSDDANAPSDATDFRTEQGLDTEVADPYLHIIETGMCADVPADILAEFDAIQSPVFGEDELAVVPADRLEAMILVVEQRGFTVVRD